jgi:hypothetical protein
VGLDFGFKLDRFLGWLARTPEESNSKSISQEGFFFDEWIFAKASLMHVSLFGVVVNAIILRKLNQILKR